MARVRSKHSNLLNYFIHDRRDLSPAYVRKCEKFLHSINHLLIKKKDAAALFKLQASKRVGPPSTLKLASCQENYFYFLFDFWD